MCGGHINTINISTQFTYPIYNLFAFCFVRPFRFSLLGDHWNSGSKCGKIQFNGRIHKYIQTHTRTHTIKRIYREKEKVKKRSRNLFIYLFPPFFCLCKYKYSNVFQQKVRLKMVCGRRNAHTQAITMNNEQQRRKEPSWYSFTQRHDVIKYDELNGKSFADVYPTQCTYCDSIRFHQLFIFRLSVSQCVYA